MKKLILALALSVTILTTLLVTPVSADGGYFETHTCYMIAGPWKWVEHTEDDYTYGTWEPPPSALGAIDLRSLPEVAEQGGTPGWGLFFCTEEINGSYISLGTDFNLDLPPAVKNALQNKYGITISAYTVNGTIWEMFVEDGDPTGNDRWKPLVPEHDGTLIININGFSPVVFAKDPPRHDSGNHKGWDKGKHNKHRYDNNRHYDNKNGKKNFKPPKNKNNSRGKKR